MKIGRFFCLGLGVQMLLSSQPIWAADNRPCYEQLLPLHILEEPMQRYLEKLRSTTWEGVKPFGKLEGKKLYMSREFDQLTLAQKAQVLDLLLLDYGDYTPLIQLIDPKKQRHILRGPGVMAPFEVYTSDGRILSYPYNACNRLTVLTEYERERLSFLGIKIQRIQRYPLARWQQEQIKKLFWENLGYDKAGDYWIAWVPEQGYFEINLPASAQIQELAVFFAKAPAYYYHVLMPGKKGMTFFQGKKLTE